ncbi:hypothetical protein HGM15179_012118 [Zosterops borbonicus]|uniref:Shisa N-terminal domain-containing protein n=1 Tax=Zosterops borbonicus TaxID=364589 RepID=A0A8K1LI95_9PASS|nr:hypothetical protein HGM15179_012118 [Zosterops borbonicus]
MGPRHLLLPLLLLSLQLLALLLLLPAQAAGPPRAKGNRTQGAVAARRTPKPGKELLNQTLAGPGAAAPTALPGRGKGAGGGKSAPGGGGGGGSAPAHETCWGYYDVSGQWDKEFECNNSLTGFRYCCGTCFYRFCCNKRAEKLNQSLCRNYKSPEWAHPTTASGALPADGSDGGDGDANKYDPDKDSTNATVYISCGAIAFVLIAGVFAKVAYDKARRPPREMNIHRALADILRQQGPIPIGHCERETISAIDTSPKENTPVRTSSKNHYTPVRTSKSNPAVATINSQIMADRKLIPCRDDELIKQLYSVGFTKSQWTKETQILPPSWYKSLILQHSTCLKCSFILSLLLAPPH